MTDPRLCFVAMPFASHLNNVYDAIERVATDYCGLKVLRADKMTRSELITEEIHNGIKNSRFVIADLTGNSANVFYEVGMAKGREKRLVLLTQDEDNVPFDLKGIRYLQYNPADLTSLREEIVPFIRNCISTIPDDWNRSYRPSEWNGAYIKITSLESPSSIEHGHPFEIRVTARNNGPAANQGYFSVSFPDGVDKVEIIESNADTQLGLGGDGWASDTITLSYPIAEGFKYGEGPAWASGKEYFIRVQGYAKRKGLFWFYVNSSSYDKSLDGRRWDPERRLLEQDQRDEDVYCGTIDIVKRR